MVKTRVQLELRACYIDSIAPEVRRLHRRQRVEIRILTWRPPWRTRLAAFRGIAAFLRPVDIGRWASTRAEWNQALAEELSCRWVLGPLLEPHVSVHRR